MSAKELRLHAEEAKGLFIKAGQADVSELVGLVVSGGLQVGVLEKKWLRGFSVFLRCLGEPFV